MKTILDAIFMPIMAGTMFTLLCLMVKYGYIENIRINRRKFYTYLLLSIGSLYLIEIIWYFI